MSNQEQVNSSSLRRQRQAARNRRPFGADWRRNERGNGSLVGDTEVVATTVDNSGSGINGEKED